MKNQLWVWLAVSSLSVGCEKILPSEIIVKVQPQSSSTPAPTPVPSPVINPTPMPPIVSSPTPKPVVSPAPTAEPPIQNSSTCQSVSEGSTAQLSCPSGKVISSVSFASYGTPAGSCGSLSLGSCHASQSKSVVESLCLGKANCSVGASNSLFGDPCLNTAKKLVIAVSCGSAPVSTPSPAPSAAPSAAPTSTPPTSGPSGASLIWYDAAEALPQVSWGIDFTKGYSMWTGGTQNLSNQDPRNTMKVTKACARKGNGGYHARVEKRMDYPGCCNWVRSEFMWMAPSQQTSQNVWRWASISTMIPEAMKFENRPLLIAFDHKALPDDYKTPFGLMIQDGKYFVGGYGFNDFVIGPVVKGQWEDWVLERNFENSSAGFIRFYRNGVKIWEHYGPNYRRNSGDAPVPRIQHGLYKWVWATSNGQGWGEGTPIDAAVAPIEMCMDEIRFGNEKNKLEDFLVK